MNKDVRSMLDAQMNKDVRSMLDALLLPLAIRTAVQHHEGKNDRNGQAYIGHPLRVMAGCLYSETDNARLGIIAVLHDTIEDSDYTIEEARATFGNEVADALDAISRRPGEKYFDYIRRCATNLDATKVKIVDIADNSDPRRTAGHPDLEAMVRERYAPALRILIPEEAMVRDS